MMLLYKKDPARNMQDLYVRSTGLELVPVAGHAPQTCAYADSATTADEQMELYGPGNTLSRSFLH